MSSEEIDRASKVAKTHKGRKILAKRQGQEIEDPKVSIVLRGNNCNQVAKDVIKSLHKMRDPLHSIILGKKKNEVYPFEDTAFLEKMC